MKKRYLWLFIPIIWYGFIVLFIPTVITCSTRTKQVMVQCNLRNAYVINHDTKEIGPKPLQEFISQVNSDGNSHSDSKERYQYYYHEDAIIATPSQEWFYEHNIFVRILFLNFDKVYNRSYLINLNKSGIPHTIGHP